MSSTINPLGNSSVPLPVNSNETNAEVAAQTELLISQGLQGETDSQQQSAVSKDDPPPPPPPPSPMDMFGDNS